MHLGDAKTRMAQLMASSLQYSKRLSARVLSVSRWKETVLFRFAQLGQLPGERRSGSMAVGFVVWRKDKENGREWGLDGLGRWEPGKVEGSRRIWADYPAAERILEGLTGVGRGSQTGTGRLDCAVRGA